MKLKKLVSAAAALAISVSAFAGITVQAKVYDAESVDISTFGNSYDSSTNTASFTGKSARNKSGWYKLDLTPYTQKTGEATRKVTVTYTDAITNNSGRLAVGFYDEDKGQAYDGNSTWAFSTGAAFCYGYTGGNNQGRMYVEGTQKVSANNAAWVTSSSNDVTLVFDFDAKTVTGNLGTTAINYPITYDSIDTLAINYWNASNIGYTMQDLTVAVETSADTYYDVYVNYIDGDNATVASTVHETVKQGETYTPAYEAAIYTDAYKYTYSSGAGDYTINDNTTIDIVYTKTARASITGTVIAQNESGIEIGRYSNKVLEPETSVDVAINKYIYSELTDKWYVADTDLFSRTYTVDGSSETVKYLEASDVVFFQEAEDAAVTNKADNWSHYGGTYSGGRDVTTNRTDATVTFDSFTVPVSGTYSIVIPHSSDSSSHTALVSVNNTQIGSYYNGTEFEVEQHMAANTEYTISIKTSYSTMPATDYLVVKLVEADTADPVFTTATDIAQDSEMMSVTFRFLAKAVYEGNVDGYGFRIVNFNDADQNVGEEIAAPGSYTEETVTTGTKDVEFIDKYDFVSGKTYYYDIAEIPTYGIVVPGAMGVYAVPYIIKSADEEKGTSAMRIWGTPFASHTDALFKTAE